MSKMLWMLIAGGALISAAMAVGTAAAADTQQTNSLVAEPYAGSAPAANRRRRADRDARECLRFNTNTEIARCAEKYR